MLMIYGLWLFLRVFCTVCHANSSGIRARIRPLGTLNQGEARYPLDIDAETGASSEDILQLVEDVDSVAKSAPEAHGFVTIPLAPCHLFVYDPHAQPNHSMTLDNRADRARHP